MTISRGWLLTIVATLFAGCLGWMYGTRSIPDPLPVGDRVQAAVAGLRTSHIYVDPDSAGLLTAQDHKRLDRAAASARPETFIVVWHDTREGGYYLRSDALEQIGQELGRPGHYVTVGSGGLSSIDVGIKGDYVSTYDILDDDSELTSSVVADAIDKIIEENDGRDYKEASTTGSDYWGGPWGTLAAGTLMGGLAGLALAGLAAAAWFTIRHRRSRG